MSKKVLVIGGTGMLGSMVVDVLKKNSDIDLYATAREPALNAAISKNSGVKWLFFDATASWESLVGLFGCEWVINCIGMTKPYTHDNNREEIVRAVRNNIELPHIIASCAEMCDSQIIQIATDCVYSGRDGMYTEDKKHDSTDVYGKTKSLGEVISDNVTNLRCSIIGPEAKNNDYLLTWFLGQEQNAKCKGFINHDWNGITTLHFAKICEGIILNDKKDLPNIQHIVPKCVVTKAEMLHQFAELYNRQDIEIEDVNAPVVVNRVLMTDQYEVNDQLWKMAGYESNPPTVKEMIEEMSKYDYSFKL